MTTNLVTPITPAVVLGHVNAAPRRTTLAACGWQPEGHASGLMQMAPFGA